MTTPKGYVQITGLSTAKTVGPFPPGHSKAVIVPETQNVRWRDDGTDPTASVGMLLAAGDALHYDGNLSALKFIEVTASAKLNVTFYSS